ncbi:FHA domain-containing protein [Saccharopolyspora sp. K220]|uniref:FHA domain-containing protein n=1 Tax=Saccharopolyspora soli TaxID=2926618 RepID=UPI001F56F6C3|nr:FHA domain-containing protein [Saccharopolyspora soli]MCI2421356.1 FHA domain-containing protein [Saccharopolyspora soli]
MAIREFVPQVLPGSTRSLAGGVPSAPPGTIFALAADGGFAVPPRKFTIHFGRGKDDVHVPIGVNDPHVSRLHGMLVCDGRDWWIRNRGKLPIQLPGEVMLLSGHELPIEPGYTPLLIGPSKRRAHLLEIHLVDSPSTDADSGQHSRTKAPDVYELSLVERLVLTALAQRYLRQERYPQPVSWNQVADDLNRLPDGRQWTSKIAAHIVGAVRERLAEGPDPIPGIRREDGVGDPVGNTLNHNLIQALLRSTTLMPSDLHLLGEDPDVAGQRGD